jgi:Mycothiol maleylpyruvate isomerase N-terminal domain
MSVDRSFIGENSRQRERLRTLVSRLSDADLRRALGEGWTVSTALAHMAFWDRRALGMLERWEHGEAPSPADPVGLNAALLPEWLALPPRETGRLVVEAAEAVDRKAEALSADLVEKIIAAGEFWRLARALHRREHLDQVERGLAG